MAEPRSASRLGRRHEAADRPRVARLRPARDRRRRGRCVAAGPGGALERPLGHRSRSRSCSLDPEEGRSDGDAHRCSLGALLVGPRSLMATLRRRATCLHIGVIDPIAAGAATLHFAADESETFRPRRADRGRSGSPAGQGVGVEAARIDRGAARVARRARPASRLSRISSIASRTSSITSRSGQVASSDARARLVVAQRDAAERRQRPVEQPDDPPDRDRRRIGRDRVAAVRPERGPDDPAVLERGHDLLEELGRQPVALGQRGQRDGPSPSWRTRSTRARRPYSERRERRMRGIVAPNA